MVEQLTQHDPRRIGPFEVLGRLGAGGMGLVYLARSASGRRVAIKTVRAELAEDQLFRVRFSREVEAARAVSGFYTAAVVDADARAAVPWLATAYVPAPSLEEIINEAGPMPAQAVRWLAAGVAEALQSIHGAGLVHRDMKPSNVLVVEDGPRVIDFGIASGVSNTRLTMTNVAVGTPAYMSPEQARDSRSVRGASDVFSLGSTLVFAATGHAPFHGANPVETVFMLLREGPNLTGLPSELRPLIESCMRLEADQRPTPAELQAQLAPHLFSTGSDDTGTASAWLPPGAVALIEQRRSGRPAVAVNVNVRPSQPPPPPPPVPPRTPDPEPAVHGRHGGGRGGSGGGMNAPGGLNGPGAGRGGALAEPHTHGPVRLAGSAPIGPGLRVADADHKAAPPEGAPGTDWVRRGGAHRAGGPGALPVQQPVQQPAPPSAPPGEWRPWRFRMSNDVWGTPVVSDGRLYVTSFEVHALDIASGRRQFKTRDVAWTMAVADGRIHASDGPSLYAVDTTDGGDRWRTGVEGWIYSLRAEHGTVVTGTRGGGVQAWDADQGHLRWERGGAQTEFESPESGPSIAAGMVYFQGGGRLYAIDGASGAERWSYPVGASGAPGATGSVPTRPVVADGVVYVTAGTRVLALDARSGAERWRFDAPAVMFGPPAHVPGAGASGGGVYVADHLGTVYALDPHNGGDRWRVATEPRQSLEPVLVAGGDVLLGAGNALYTLDAVTGNPKWRFAAQGEIVGSPVVADGRVHFGSKDHCLYTVDAAGGQLRWKLETGGEITGSPVAADGVVYACSKDRCVYALDAVKGTGAAARRA
ncbi:PQQ-binding-like beta-propeller repeat protein [Streptomyces sp. H10-C2]|uniref:serine/threonine-protein kinase n=1 Tax=unclassified Streptomyces TaxID=2593676 RepID=UPI0024B9DC73|nr:MULTISPECIES: PQQ-binding-like beta-propeller repeat protein [unclassified Streptomyces]MDJ0342425.1 PQQ-binding-like beta-propeller repeat protein [Streptomyces sp. PH10-H1]MDJ0372280.1 PQQ-binding-like beta-propeller repeat protein [Streptomyces sp. H10-C2]